MTLQAIPVDNALRVDMVRIIRNTCRDGFSSFNDEIAVHEQRRWWAAQGDDVRAWLYADRDAQIVGFGLLRREDGRWYTTVAVLPEHAGHGYGKAITHDIVVRCEGRTWATARRDNPAAVKLHDLADWDVIDGPDPRLVYFRGKYGDDGRQDERWVP